MMTQKSLEACRQKLANQLARLNRQIAEERKRLAQIESGMAALVQDQRKAG